jgi:type VI secretion system secreted protein VgrG
MPYTQDDRLIAIDTPLGKDVLLLSGFRGAEGLSCLFSFELNLLSENHKIPFEDIIGKSVTISIDLADGDKRAFNGIIARFSQGRGSGEAGGGEAGPDSRFSHYRATLVPWLWLLTMTADSRIFQKLSVPQIVEKIFQEKGFSDFKLKLHGSYAKREYCVQYRETDFNFISRLLEEEGVYYYFEHETGKHTMIIADDPQEHEHCPKQETARYQLTGGGLLEEDVIRSLEKVQEIRPGKFSLNDYNFEIPNTGLEVNVPGKYKLGPGEREIYDYPGSYAKKTEGDRLAKIRMEEEEAKVTTLHGSSSCRAFTSGYRFTLLQFYRDDLNNKDYVLSGLHHEANQGLENDAELVYANQFTCIPFDVPYRPPRVTPKPVVRGGQTAIVVGPSGEEIYTDEHGRVKVQFHWDREGRKDEKSSCWMRVSQLWAGAGWGAMYIPRIGHEVIVDFLEGDPDQPIITGRVYHGTNKPPYALPAEKTKSTIKSDSSLGSGGSNEFRFEDKKGSEEVYLHGQKDWTIAIENDKNQTVGHDETLSVGHDQTIKVGNNRTKSVGVDQSESVGSNKSINVGANHDETIGANKTLTVGANHTESIGSNMSITIGQNKTETVTINTAETIGVAKELTIGGLYQVSVGAAMNETIGAAKAEEIGALKSVNVGASSSENVGINKSVNAGGNITEKAGKDVAIQSGKKMVLSAGDDFGVSGGKNGVIEIKDQLTIKCGSASITMKKNGDITIQGKNINIKGSGDIVMKANKILEN